MKRRLIYLAAGIALSGILLGILLRAVDASTVASAVAQVDARLLLCGVGLHLSAMWVRSVLWRRLLAVPASTGMLFRVSVVGFAVSYVMPLRVGEFARAYLLARWRGIPYGTTLASLFAERVLDGLAVATILLVVALSVPAPDYVVALGVVVAGIFGGLASVLAVISWRASALVSLSSAVGEHLPRGWAVMVERLAHGFANGVKPLRNWRALPGLLALSMVGWSCQFAVFYVVMLAFPIPASIAVAALGGGVANFATLLPSAPGNVGTFDASIVKLLMDMLPVSLENAAAYALVVHLVVVVPIVSLGALILWRSDLALGQVLGWSLGARGASPAATIPAAAEVNTSALPI